MTIRISMNRRRFLGTTAAEAMTVTLKDVEDRALWSVELPADVRT